MAELFLFGTFWFWVLTAAAIIIVTALTENEQGAGATICLLVYCGLLQWCGGVDILGYLLHHPVYVFITVASYFLIGTIWGFARWVIFVKGRSQDLIEAIRDYCNEKKITYSKPLEPEIWKSFKEEVETDRYSSHRNVQPLLTAPRIRDHKERFIRWLSFWPISMLYTLFNDAVRNICRQIYLAAADRLQAISDGIYNRALPK